jgi:Ran GTPase-activating protein (RanGAP) involved in mRNA processing and transport
LCLGDNKFQNIEFNQIANFFSSNPPLQVLDLSNNAISCECSDILGANLKKAKQLKCLILNNTKLNDESGPQVLNSIHETNIEEIELDMNIFAESGPFVIMNKIRKAANVKKLSLKRCGMTPQFLNIIAANIMDNQNLKEINLEGNDFEEEVFVKFCEDIKANKITKIIFTKDLLLGNVKDVLNENIILM